MKVSLYANVAIKLVYVQTLISTLTRSATLARSIIELMSLLHSINVSRFFLPAK